jgi:stringent starvation protein B
MARKQGSEGHGSSTRPYLIRALHDWCTDNGFTPYVAVYVDASVQVPMEYVKNHEIVLNVGFEATSGLKLGNEFIEFKARFGGVTRDIVVPVDHVVAIYARENGQGMAFPTPSDTAATAAAPVSPGAASPPSARGALRLASTEESAGAEADKPGEGAGSTGGTSSSGGSDSQNSPNPPPDPPDPPAGGPRPSLKRIK